MNTSTINDIYVEGVKLYPTSEAPSYNLADLQASGVRSWETGIMKLNPLRYDVFSVDLQWTNIPIAEAIKILKLIKPKEDGGNLCNVYDPIEGIRKTSRMYRSDRKYSSKVYRSGVYADLSFSLIEM